MPDRLEVLLAIAYERLVILKNREKDNCSRQWLSGFAWGAGVVVFWWLVWGEVQMRKFTNLYIPESGLYYSNGKFSDGHGKVFDWNHTITLYASARRAHAAKERLELRGEYRHGTIVTLNVETREVVDESLEDIENAHF